MHTTKAISYETRTHKLSNGQPGAYTTRYVCSCGKKGRWTAPDHAEHLAVVHHCRPSL